MTSGPAHEVPIAASAAVGPPASACAGPLLLKSCTKCGEEKPITEFSFDGTGGSRRGSCKACDAVYQKMWKAANSEKERARAKARYAANAEKILARSKAYHVANPEKVKARVRAWRAANPEKVRANLAYRRAKKLDAPGYEYTTVQHITWRWEMWGGRCYLCNAPAEHTDHVIPLGVGGPHWPSNLRPVCSLCNSKRPKNGDDLPTRKKSKLFS